MFRNEKFCQKLCTIILLSGIILVGSAVNSAGAASSQYANYGRVGLGVNDFRGDLDDAGYDAGVNISGTYGRYLGQYLVLEGTLDYFQSDRDRTGSTALAGLYSVEDSLQVGTVLVTVKAELPLDRLALYSGVGVGGYSVTLESDIDTTSLGDFETDDDDFVFGLHLVVGGNFDLTDRIFVGIEGMYRWTDDVDIEKTVGTVPVRLTDNLDGYAVNVTCGFRF